VREIGGINAPAPIHDPMIEGEGSVINSLSGRFVVLPVTQHFTMAER